MAEPQRRSMTLSEEQREELSDQFKTLDKDGNGYLDMSELKRALDIVGFKIPQWQVRQMIDELDRRNFNKEKGQLSFEEFQKLYTDLKSKDVSSQFKTVVSKRENLQTLGGMSEASSEGTTHSVRHEEQVAFSDWINSNLGVDSDLQHLLPIDQEGRMLYERVKDGILLCKIINHSCAETIDERAINKKNLTVYTKHENLTLALNSAQAIGCNIINIDAHDLAKGKPHLVLGLLWQIIRIGLFNQITLEQCPGLVQLLFPGEEMADLLKLSPENILIRWVNYHLERAGVARRLTNFTSDVKDSEIYTHLLYQISPYEAGVTTEALREPNLVSRAEIMLQQADKIRCRSFLTPNDVVEGVYKLNVAFVANLFNNHPALDKPEVPLELENLEETREEKTYRNWMNSMGVNPHVNWLYSDLADGLVIFQLFDIIKPGVVSWNKVHRMFSKLKGFMEKLENCNYAVDLGKKLKFSLVGIAGNDISEGNPTLTLALVWQLMRAYTLSILTQLAATGNPIVETQIVEWVNKKLREAGKPTSVRSFQDSAISDATPVIHLIDAIQPGSINYSAVLPGSDDDEKMANAKYAISVARKIGARIYALPEDIVEVKPKMVMTVFACLMGRDYIPNMGVKSPNNSNE
ncbi:plastin-2 fimbrin isoform X1 [Tachypleus tridentatus]|uniref:plastin-2 fimbrin isoform X1 n=1 Tax=Tachypleus tridentatus TaxID=6853 RepID=UPI003FD2C8EB